MADDGGRVCDWSAVDALGCCTGSALEPCTSCDAASSCCSEFEFCVACCLRGDVVASGGWQGAKVSPVHPEFTWPSAFAFCSGACRTTSRSTMHENAYASPAHHCFGSSPYPAALPKPVLTALPDGVVAVAAEQGVSCSAACSSSGRKCIAAVLPTLNSCAWLLATFPCEAGCDELGSAAHLPAYNSGPAPDASTKCGATTGAVSCDAAQPHARRLCPCGA